MTGRSPHVETQHVDIEPLLATYRELDEASRQRVDAHLAECPDCAARLAEFEAMDRQIADLADPPPDVAAVGAWRAAMRLRGDAKAAPATTRRTADSPAGRQSRGARGEARHRPGLAIVASAALVLGLIVFVASGIPVARPLQDALVRWGRDPLPTEPAPPTPTTVPADGEAVMPDASPDMDETTRDEAAESVTGNGDVILFDPQSRSSSLSVSADGRYIAFVSRASNLVPGDTNVCGPWVGRNERLGDCLDVFVRDIEAGKTWRVSIDRGGVEVDGESWAPALTPDGRYLAFRSRSNIAGSYSEACAKREYPGHCHGIYVKDLVTGEAELLYVLSDNGGIGGSYALAISPDGRHVLFDANGELDPAPGVPRPEDQPQSPRAHRLVFDRQTDTVRYASPDDRHDLGIDGAEGEVSADGQYRVFASHDATLVPGDTHACTRREEGESYIPANCSDVFVTDQVSGETERISLAPNGRQADGDSGSPTISADGRFVAFASNAANLLPDALPELPRDCGGKEQTACGSNAFVFDRDTGSLTLASGNLGLWSGPNTTLRISADGRRVVFTSFADNIFPGDLNGRRDLFVYDRESERIEAVSVAGPRPHAVYFAGKPSAGDKAVLTPDAMRQHFTDLGYRYHEAHAWSEVLNADADARIDALILDPGSLAQVDRAWLNARAELAIVLGGINVRQRELEALVGDTNSTGSDETYAGEFYSVVSRGRTHAVTGSPADGAGVTSDGAGTPAPFTSNYWDGHWGTMTESAVHDAAVIADNYGEAMERAGIRWEPWHPFFRDVSQAVGNLYLVEQYGALGTEPAGAGGE
jgi:hypothetical protein